MKLNPEQIEQLYAYSEDRNVVFCDIQQEIVDHLASGIEERMAQHGETFEEAFQRFVELHGNELQHMNRKPLFVSPVVLRAYGKCLLRWPMLAFGLLEILWLPGWLAGQDERFMRREFFNMGPLVTMACSLMTVGMVWLWTRRRFYYIESVIQMYGVICLLGLCFDLYADGKWSHFLAIAYLYFCAAMVFYIFDNLRTFYTKKIHLLAKTT